MAILYSNLLPFDNKYAIIFKLYKHENAGYYWHIIRLYAAEEHVMINIWRWAGSDYVKLIPVLALAFYMAFIPHQSYDYPVHLDEWNNYTYTQAITSSHSISFPDPWLGGGVQRYPNPEVGYNVFWSVLHMISGIPLLTIYRYFPAVILMVTALAVYILGRRQGFGWEAALFVCLIPTTIGILGPAFMVPIALGLPFIPLSLYIVLNHRNWWSYVILYVFMMLLLAIHAPTGVGLLIVLVPYILLSFKGDYKHALGVLFASVLPFVFGFPWVGTILRVETEGLLSASEITKNVALPHIMGEYGYLPAAFCAIGIIALVIRGGRQHYGLILGLLLLLLMLVVRYSFHYGDDIMYFRGLHYMMLMMSIIAGAGLMLVRKIKVPDRLVERLKLPKLPGLPVMLIRNIGVIICLVLIGVTLNNAIPERQHTGYYYMINQDDYQSFVWINENVSSNYSRAVLDPWKATAFTAITGRYIHTRIGEAPTVRDVEAIGFLNSGCKDTNFLINNDISIVYTPVQVDNPDLVEVRRYIYLLEEPRVP